MSDKNKTQLLAHNERLEQISATLDVLPVLEDLTPELNDQADIITAINDLLGLKGQAVPYGDYAWKRSGEVPATVENPTFTATTYTTLRAYTISSTSFDPTKVDAQFFDGFKDQYSYEFKWNGTELTWTSSVGTEYTVTYDSSTCVLTFNSNINNTLQSGSYSGTKELAYDTNFEFIDYIVSSSSDAYPDGDYDENGYYYEKVKDPVPTMEYGSVSCASEVASVTVQHSLGVAPSKVYLIRDAGFTSGYGWAQLNGTAIRCYSSSVHSAKANTVTDTSITFIPYSSSYGWYGTYTWIAIV